MTAVSTSLCSILKHPIGTPALAVTSDTLPSSRCWCEIYRWSCHSLWICATNVPSIRLFPPLGKLLNPPQSRFLPALSPLQFSQCWPLCLQTFKLCWQNFPLFSTWVMWFPTLLMWVEYHIHMGGHALSVLGKSRRLIQTNLRLLNWNSNVLESASIIRRSTSPFASPLHMVPKKDES